MDESTKKIIIEGVKDVGNRLMTLFRKGQIYKFKESGHKFDYKIAADKEAEKIILDAIKKTGLDCGIISEESDIIENKIAEYKIYIDPLDGTVNFSKGIPVFCVGVGVFYKDEPYFGIVYDPTHKELFIAEKGKGVFINGKKINLPIITEKILINLEWYGAESYGETIAKLKKAGIRARTAGSGVLALCYGAIGRGDGTVLLENSPWDIAPGMVMAKEAGYTLKEMDGSEVDLSKGRISIIAAPESVFKKIEAALK